MLGSEKESMAYRFWHCSQNMEGSKEGRKGGVAVCGKQRELNRARAVG